MTVGVVGQKRGMTRVFTESGESVPVTVIEVQPNMVVQVKTKEIDGYSAIQVTTGAQKASRLTKPVLGHYAKAKQEPGKGLWEFRLDGLASNDFAVGAEINIDIFSEGQMVDVTSTSKGKGFAGTVKRHNFSMQDATHGNSLSHRVPGSIGQNQSPGRVFKGKKMSGQMGNVKTTVLSQRIVRLDQDKKIVLVRGTVPGAPGGTVILRPAVKKTVQQAEVTK